MRLLYNQMRHKILKSTKTVEKHRLFMKLAKTVITAQETRPDLEAP